MEDFKQWAQQHLHSGSDSSRKLSVQVSFACKTTVDGFDAYLPMWAPRL